MHIVYRYTQIALVYRASQIKNGIQLFESTNKAILAIYRDISYCTNNTPVNPVDNLHVHLHIVHHIVPGCSTYTWADPECPGLLYTILWLFSFIA